MKRSSGVLMHISSLPSNYGIGTFGSEAKKFVDFLADAGQSYWQILPLNQTSYGDSPYQSFSSFAGNPYFIDLDYLNRDNLLDKADYEDVDYECDECSINYGVMYEKRYPILRKAVRNMFERWDLSDYYAFLDENDWVDNYALFMAIKKSQNNVGLFDWKENYRLKDEETIRQFIADNEEELSFWKGIQYLFYHYWFEIKDYANKKGIKIIGDCPIYVALDSCDLWSDPDLYQVDENLKPKRIAGCPPDGFSAIGQLWGNPLYEWENHAKKGYEWWIKRVKHLSTIYDVLRIDHFRGLESYYSIDVDASTAADGYWVKGPSKDLIKAIKDSIYAEIIAEDLGFMDDDVKDLLKYSDYPGMSVMQFGFDDRDSDSNDNLPHNFRKNSVCYIGTHDNQTIMGWIKTIPKKQLQYAKEYLNIHDDESFVWGMIRALFASNADLVIVQAQDLLGLGDEARMNTPNSIGENWKWRARKNVFNKHLAKKLKYLSSLYSRNLKGE